MQYQIYSRSTVSKENHVCVTGEAECLSFINKKFNKNFTALKDGIPTLIAYGYDLFFTLFIGEWEYTVLCGNEENSFTLNKENNNTSIGIGLWFGLAGLMEYDGCYQLSDETIKVIRAMGFNVPEEFEN
jgi:hypothetical protein